MMTAIVEDCRYFGGLAIWDNSVADDWKCAGRYMAAITAATPFVYFQDDDVRVPRFTMAGLCAEFDPDDDVIVANWGHGANADGYDDLPLVCGGAIVRQDAPWKAALEYARHWPLDDEFAYEADFVIGALYPRFRHVHFPFDINMPVAQHPSRLVNQPWQKATKLKVTERARAIRDKALVTA